MDNTPQPTSINTGERRVESSEHEASHADECRAFRRKLKNYLKGLQVRIEYLEQQLAITQSNVAALQGQALENAVEPMFDKSLLPSMIPCTPSQLDWLLRKYRDLFPPRYRFRDGQGRRIRVFAATEIKLLRKLVIIPSRKGKRFEHEQRTITEEAERQTERLEEQLLT